MTENQQMHRNEQMEAARAEFRHLWASEFVPNMYMLPEKAVGSIQQFCWASFLHGKGLRHTKPAQ